MNIHIRTTAISLFIIFILTIPLGLPPQVIAGASACKPISAPYTMKDRFGLSGNDGDNPAIADLGVSWYMNWGYKPDNSATAIEYLPMVIPDFW